MASSSHRPKDGDNPDQASMFEPESLVPPTQKGQAYYCRNCGSTSLVGMSPTTDEKRRWMTAALCNGCGKANVIAVRGL